jgi:hypothetical protein
VNCGVVSQPVSSLGLIPLSRSKGPDSFSRHGSWLSIHLSDLTFTLQPHCAQCSGSSSIHKVGRHAAHRIQLPASQGLSQCQGAPRLHIFLDQGRPKSDVQHGNTAPPARSRSTLAREVHPARYFFCLRNNRHLSLRSCNPAVGCRLLLGWWA